MQQTKFFSFWNIFFPFTPLPPLIQKIKILKKWRKKKKKPYRFHHFTQVNHKLQSYDIWFLRYKLQQTVFFCHLGSFFALLPPPPLPPFPPNSLKNEKETWRYIILHKCTKTRDHRLYIVPEIWCVTDVIVIFHFGLFFSLLPP